MAEEGFRLPGSSYEDLVNIIVAYGTRDEASNPGDVSKLDVVHQSSVSRNNAFLLSIGILAGERQKFVTEKGRALAVALAHKDRDAIQRKWRELVAREVFMQNVLSAVKLREGIFHSTLQAYIAHYAGQPRNKPVMTGASAIIGILKAAGLLHEEDGMLVADYDESPGESPMEPPAMAPVATGQPELGSEPEAEGNGFDQGDLLGVEEYRATSADDPEQGLEVSFSPDPDAEASESLVKVHVHVNCGPEELEGLAPKIKRLMREIDGG